MFVESDGLDADSGIASNLSNCKRTHRCSSFTLTIHPVPYYGVKGEQRSHFVSIVVNKHCKQQTSLSYLARFHITDYNRVNHQYQHVVIISSLNNYWEKLWHQSN